VYIDTLEPMARQAKHWKKVAYANKGTTEQYQQKQTESNSFGMFHQLFKWFVTVANPITSPPCSLSTVACAAASAVNVCHCITHPSVSVVCVCHGVHAVMCGGGSVVVHALPTPGLPWQRRMQPPHLPSLSCG